LGRALPTDDHVHPGATIAVADDLRTALSNDPRHAAADHAATDHAATASHGTATTDGAADAQAHEAAAY
jgi:hypothetical protein